MVRTGGAGPNGISCIVVEKGTPGLSFGAQEKKLGWNSAADRDGDVRELPGAGGQPASAGKGEGFKIAMMGLDGGRTQHRAPARSAARSICLDRTASSYMRDRKQFGARLSDFQALQLQASPTMATEIEAARLMVRRAAHAARPRNRPARRGLRRWRKRFATDAGFRGGQRAACNCMAATATCAIIRSSACLRDVRVHQILEGTNEIMRLIISRRLLDGDDACHPEAAAEGPVRQ